MQPSAGAGALPRDLKSDVVDIVSDALRWRLTDARWAQVEQLLDALRMALQSGDPHTVEAAVIDLELVAPLRIIPIGVNPIGPPAPQLRRLAIQIVHDLGEDLWPDEPPDMPEEDRHDETGTGHGTSGR
jgi:CATRA-associated small protein